MRKMPPLYFYELVGMNIHRVIFSLGLQVVLGSHWFPREQQQINGHLKAELTHESLHEGVLN